MIKINFPPLFFFTEETLVVKEGKGLSPGHERRDGDSKLRLLPSAPPGVLTLMRGAGTRLSGVSWELENLGISCLFLLVPPDPRST